MARQYPTMAIPSTPAVNPLGAMMDLYSMAQQVRQMKRQNEADAANEAVAAALGQAQGDVTGAIDLLGQQGRWSEATILRERAHKIREGQQNELAASLKRSREGFETGTRLLQGVEAAQTPAEKAAMFATIRPQLLEALPGFAQYIPETFDADPSFVERAIPLGLSYSEAAKRRSEAVDALNARRGQQKDQLALDTDVVKALGAWLHDADDGEDVMQAIETAEKTYGASPAVGALLADFATPGPLTPERRTAMVGRLVGPQGAPNTFAEALLAAHAKGDKAGVQGILKLQGQLAAAGRQGETMVTPDMITAVMNNPTLWSAVNPELRGKLLAPLAAKGFDFTAAGGDRTRQEDAEIWRIGALRDLDAQKANLNYNITDAQYAAAKAQIEQEYRLRAGGQVSPSTPANADAAWRNRQRTLPRSLQDPAYRDGAASTPAAPRAAEPTAAASRPPAGAPAVGSTVEYPKGSGKKYTISGYTKDGQAQLDPLP